MEIFARKHFRSNSLLLWMVRVGIYLRRAIARIDERFPNWKFAAFDIIAVIVGLLLGTFVKTGDALKFPTWALVPILAFTPLAFVAAITLAGGYGSDDRTLKNTFVGYLLGFFVVNTLQFFFKDFGFSRGIPLAITGIGAAIGITARFVRILHRRVYGSEAIRRIAFLSRSVVRSEQRNIVRNMFLGRPVTIVGSIAPTFSELDVLGENVLGTVESIAKIVTAQRLTDIVVLDANLSYGQVLRAMNLTANKSVRFHIASSSAESSAVDAPTAVRARRKGPRLVKKITDRLISVCILIFIVPVVYLTSRRAAVKSRPLLEAALGRRPLVYGGPSRAVNMRDPVFTVAELYQDESLDQNELARIEEFYTMNQSLLLDCEIILAIIRLRTTAQAKSLPGE
jgi:hypothetical protein